ncbi:MAG: ComEC/Rec2 family competence protein, partial [Methylobacterium mesophilicum]|nr:ComEC/Rec2 family competence protein [Methylobacterium mesophilicum]
MAEALGRDEAHAPIPLSWRRWATIRHALVDAGRADSPPAKLSAGALRDRFAGRIAHRSRGVRAALALEAERGVLFLCIPLLLGIGAVAYFTMPTEPRGDALLLALGSTALLAFAFHRRNSLSLAAFAIFLVVLGIAAGKGEMLRASTRMLGAAVATHVTGRVESVDRLTEKRVRLTLDVLATDQPMLRFSPERIRITAARIGFPVEAGMVVSGLVRLMPPSGPILPGGYDFSFRSYFEGIGATGFFLGSPAAGDADGRSGSWADRLENWRQRLADHIRSRIGGPEGEVAAALIVGVRGGIPENVNEALRRTGLAHILSISGLHMALVAATVMTTIRAALALLPRFASRRAIKKAAAVAALGAVSIYVLFSGSDVAALRSYIMLAIMLSAVLFDRAALTMRNLALAAIVLLLWMPHEIMGPSFQMSFAATAALIAGFAGRPRRDQTGNAPRTGHRPLVLLRWALSVLLALAGTSLLAGLATAPFGVYHFQRISPLSLPANLLTAPIVSILVMPFAMLGMLFMPLGLDGPFFSVMGFGLRLMLAVTQWLSARSPIDGVGTIPVSALLLGIAAIVLFSVLTTKLRYAALGLAAAAFAAVHFGQAPDILVSEDAKLVALAAGDGRLAVTAHGGGGFTLENWQRALEAARVVRPVDGDQVQAATLRSGVFACMDD